MPDIYKFNPRRPVTPASLRLVRQTARRYDWLQTVLTFLGVIR